MGTRDRFPFRLNGVSELRHNWPSQFTVSKVQCSIKLIICITLKTCYEPRNKNIYKVIKKSYARLKEDREVLFIRRLNQRISYFLLVQIEFTSLLKKLNIKTFMKNHQNTKIPEKTTCVWPLLSVSV